MGLDGFHVIDVEEEDDGRLIVMVESAPTVLGWPGVRAFASHGHNPAVAEFVDAPSFGWPVRLRWRKQRWLCPEPHAPRAPSSNKTTPVRCRVGCRRPGFAINSPLAETPPPARRSGHWRIPPRPAERSWPAAPPLQLWCLSAPPFPINLVVTRVKRQSWAGLFAHASIVPRNREYIFHATSQMVAAAASG